MQSPPDAELERAIDAVAASYTGQLEIDNLESALLPNRRAAIEAFELLTSALFLGFYSTHALTRETLRAALEAPMRRAHALFVAQLERALRYDARLGRGAGGDATLRAREVVGDLFARLPALRRLLDSDVSAAFEGDPAAKSVEEVVFSYPTLRAVTAHRVAHELYLANVPLIPRILSEHAHSQTGIDIHAGARIGERFFIDHGTGVVIGETTRIGRNVKLYQGVTLGALSVKRPVRSADTCVGQRHPTIEDDVTIYSGATILGGDTVIGARSVIGGNVFLTRSVPPESKIFLDVRTTPTGRSEDK